MSDLKISELLDGGSAQLTDQIAIARAGGSYELTLGEVKVLILGTLATDVSNNATAITALQNDRLKLDGSNGPMTGNLDMGANKITSTYVPAADADLVNRKYVTDNYLPLSGGTMTGAITLHSTGTPASGSEPISYTFAEATYAKATGTLNYVARFSPDGTTLDESTIRDDGSNASINGTIDSSAQLAIFSAEANALLIEASGLTGMTINGAGTNHRVGIVINNTTATAAPKIGIDMNISGSTTTHTGIELTVDSTNVTNVSYGINTTMTAPSSSTPIIGNQTTIVGATTNKMHGAFYDLSSTDQGLVIGVVVDAESDAGSSIRGFISDIYLDAISSSGKPVTSSSIYGFESDIDAVNDAAITQSVGFKSRGHSGSISTAYHLYLDAHNLTAGGTSYGIYQAGTGDINFFAGDTTVGDLTFDSAQVVTSSEDDYILTYNHSTGKISLEANAAFLTGTANRVAYFTATDTLGEDADFLFDGNHVSIGEPIDTNRTLNVYSDNDVSAILAQNVRTGAYSTAVSASSTGANSNNDNTGINTLANGATGTGNNISLHAYFSSSNPAGTPSSSDIGVLSTAYMSPTSRNTYGFYAHVDGQNSADNYGIYIDVSNAGTGNGFGIYETGAGFKNNVIRNVFSSRVTIGNADDFTSTKIMLSVEGDINDVSQTLTGYDGESAGYTSGYDEYNMTRSVSGASGYQGTTQFGARNNSVASGDFTYMTLLLGQDNSSRNCLGIIGVQASSGVSNHETDMIFGVRGSGNSNPTNPEDTRAHVQEAIRIKSGTSGSFTGGSTDNKIDATTVTAPRVQFGGSNGYTFPAEDGSPGQRLQTDGSGNLTWVTP